MDVLNPLNIEARYPLNKEKLLRSLTESRCEDLIRKAEKLLTWIKTKC
ncbi:MULTISPECIES: HEPN domain-containing protein [Acutalibacter]